MRCAEVFQPDMPLLRRFGVHDNTSVAVAEQGRLSLAARCLIWAWGWAITEGAAGTQAICRATSE